MWMFAFYLGRGLLSSGSQRTPRPSRLASPRSRGGSRREQNEERVTAHSFKLTNSGSLGYARDKTRVTHMLCHRVQAQARLKPLPLLFIALYPSPDRVLGTRISKVSSFRELAKRTNCSCSRAVGESGVRRPRGRDSNTEMGPAQLPGLSPGDCGRYSCWAGVKAARVSSRLMLRN